MIFTPQWLQEREIIPRGQAVGLEVPVSFAGPPRLSFEGLTLRVDNRHLIAGTETATEEGLLRMQEVVASVLTVLPHTPVAAIGVNFQWIEPEPEAPLLRHFQTTDADSLAASDLIIQSTSLRRKIDDAGRTINLALTLQEDHRVLFDFNFNYQVPSATAARDAVDGRVVELRNRALAILRAVYKLEPVGQ